MSLVVNTNVSSLTAQRALASSDSLQSEAMERLSTGSKINSASDDAAGLAIAQRMTSQIAGLNMAVKNANDGIAMTQSVEGALVEVADMLQRLRELSVQSANDTNTGIDRNAIQEEVNLLVAEISRVSSNTRYNNQPVLDGTYQNVKLQVGHNAGETINFSLDSISADKVGGYAMTGDLIAAEIGAGNGALANKTDDADDVIINGNSVSKTINVRALDSARDVAAKINAVAGDTGVTAEAKTYAKVYSAYATDQTMSLKINNTTTGDFVMSSSNVSDAIDKINAISGTTGVTASANEQNQVLLYSNNGSDILIENEKAVTSLRVKTVGFDSLSEVKSLAVHAKKTDNAILTQSTAHTLKNASTGANTTFTTTTTDSAAQYDSLINAALGATVGTAANRVSTADITAISTGDYFLKHAPTGDIYRLTVASADTAGWTSALSGATLVGGDHDGIARSLADEVTVSQNGSHGSLKLQLTGSRLFGDFDVFSDSITSLNIMDSAHTNFRTGVEGTGVEVTTAHGAAASGAIIATQIAAAAGAGSFSLIDGGNYTASTGVVTEEAGIRITTGGIETGNTVVVTGEDRNGNVISESIDITGAAGDYDGQLTYAKVTAISFGATTVGTLDVKLLDTTDTFTYRGAREFGDFDIVQGAATVTSSALNASATTGDIDSMDIELEAAGGNDSGTVQGTIALRSSKIFSVTQQGTEEAYSTSAPKGPRNDNYFTTGSGSLETVSNIDLRTQVGASNALSVLDSAIEKISSMRSELGAIENRLDHTVSNLMNISEKTEAARSRLQDADFASESAKLSKAQVLKQAGVGMLAQANASSQLILQLLQ
jgi:flagellin